MIVDYSVQLSDSSVRPEDLNAAVSTAVQEGVFGPDITIDPASISHNSMYS